ncbi:hypothetical protein GCM10020358_19760 [Amorphoplanes nipponensis]|uniref:Uncharacterized protein n=1 Tax=Actinoplanes nipponensis TaxID=135950 RepID=A0A919JGA1_9ACTN|nr:hypothetical protein [Actinoplanes nipponensis]GIE48661.1 hypothetical protein Ani05nite_21950 [Actinoplanes nipponensis]
MSELERLDPSGRRPAPIENPVLDNPLPGLEELLREAAAGARRRAFVPSYELVEGVARGRRTARVAARGLFGIVLAVAVGVPVALGAGRGDSGPTPPPAAVVPVETAAVVDPSMRQYQTRIPILLWTQDPRAKTDSAEWVQNFLTAVFSGLGNGDRDYSPFKDLREVFKDAPAGGPALAIDQSTTRAQLERAAANLRKLPGIRSARVIEVTGLWFTVSASRPARIVDGRWEDSPAIDPNVGFRGSAAGGGKDADGNRVVWTRATYIGPPITRAAFDRLRREAATTMGIAVSRVVVTAESAAPR